MPLEVSARLIRASNLFGNVGREVSANAALTSGQFVHRYVVAWIFQHVDFYQVSCLVQ